MEKFKALDLFRVMDEEGLLKQSLDHVLGNLPSTIYYASNSKWTMVLNEFCKLLDNYLRNNQAGHSKKM